MGTRTPETDAAPARRGSAATPAPTAAPRAATPLEDPAVISAIGNRRARAALGREGSAPAGVRELVAQALAEKSIDKVFQISGRYQGIPDEQRRALIDLVIELRAPGYLPGLWAGWPPALDLAVANDQLWQRSIKSWPQLREDVLDAELQRRFAKDVEDLARTYLSGNLALVTAEQTKLPRRNPGQRDNHVATIQDLAKSAQPLLAARDALNAVTVGQRKVYTRGGAITQSVKFDRDRKPKDGEANTPPLPTWEALVKPYDDVVAAVAGLGALSPALHRAITDGDLAILASGTQAEAGAKADASLLELTRSIEEARGAIGETVKWADLAPLHAQLLNGTAVAPSGTNWGSEGLRPLTEAMLKDHASSELWKGILTALGIGVAGLLIGLLSAGTLVPLLLGAASLGYGATQTVEAFQRAEGMSAAEGSDAGGGMSLVERGAATRAWAEAAFAGACSVLELYGLGRALRGIGPGVTGVKPGGSPPGRPPSPAAPAARPPTPAERTKAIGSEPVNDEFYDPKIRRIGTKTGSAPPPPEHVEVPLAANSDVVPPGSGTTRGTSGKPTAQGKSETGPIEATGSTESVAAGTGGGSGTSGVGTPLRRPGEGIAVTGRKGKDLAWGDPASEPCYGHSVKYHGKQLPIAKLREWAMKVFKKDQGQWLDNRFIVEAEQRAPLVAGSHAVEMGRSVGRVFHPDGRVTDNVTTVIVVRRPNLTVKVSYPYSPKSSTTGKKVRETVENSQRSARPLTDPGPGSGDGESNPR